MPLRFSLRLFLLTAWTLSAWQPALAAPAPHPATRVLAEDPTPAPTLAPAAEVVSEPASAAALEAVAPAPIGCSATTATFASVTVIPLPDPGVITGTLNVSGLSGYVWDINLVTNIVHTNTEDLDIRLISPGGIVSTISTDNGLQRDNVFNGTLWDDQATLPVTELFPVSDNPVSPLVVEEAMAAFAGANANGTWKLQIEDDTDNGSGGQLSGWSLQITTLPVYPQAIEEVFSAETDVALVDNGYLNRTLVVAGAGTTLGQLRLTTEIDHTRNDDLDIYLVSPTGITVTISTDNGGNFSSGYANITWSDRAGAGTPNGAVTDYEFLDNVSKSPQVPEGALAAFNGLNPNGTWKLIISDDLPTNTGMLDRWALEVTSYDCRPDVSVTATSAAQYAPAGAPLTYSVSLANVGGHPAANVTLAFEVTGGTLAAAPNLSGWLCGVPVGNSHKFVCSTATLHGGISTFFDVVVNTSSLPGQVAGLITATTTSTEPNLTNNTAIRLTYAGVFSANGNPWDVHDSAYGDGSGALGDGGQDAFDTWGGLRLRVSDQNFSVLTTTAALNGFGLFYQGNRRWSTTTVPVHSGVAVSRLIWAPAHANWVRYVDVFANTTGTNRPIQVVWGGNLGSDSLTTVAATSTGDTNVTGSDTWVLTIESSGFNANGPAGDAPVGAVVGSSLVDIYSGADNFNAPFAAGWTGNGNQYLGHQYGYIIPPHTTIALAYFLYRGLAEGVPGPVGCTTHCVTPAAGLQITLAQSVMIQLEANPPLCDLPASILAVIKNWPEAAACKRLFVPLIVR